MVPPRKLVVLGAVAISAAALIWSLSSDDAATVTAVARTPIVFGACGSKASPAFASAECGTLRVFENRSTRQGRMIDIHVGRWRAHSASPAGVVMLLAGGPGSDGDGLAGAVDRWASPLRDTMDIVVVDQRGTGLSNSLFCARDVVVSPASAFGRIFDDESLRACRAQLEPVADLRQYTTDFAAEDLDDVRAALGFEQVSLYGGSYGTRLAQAYMRRFPARTRSVVLDGVMPFDIDAPLTYARTAQMALDRVIESCMASVPCRFSHPSLPANLKRVLERFNSGPVQTTVTPAGQSPETVMMSRGDFGYAVRGILYDAEGARVMPGMLRRAAVSGDLSEFAQRYWQRAVSFSRAFANGLHLSVLCGEDVGFIRPDAVSAATANTFLGTYVIDEYRRACGLWTSSPASAEFRQPLTSSIPTLLLSGHFDPVTPPEFGEQVSRTIGGSRHLVWRQGAHGSVYGCGLASALHVLGTGTMTGMPDRCR
jgi:pimeloyl-ACP methyl ester carboxylesterase